MNERSRPERQAQYDIIRQIIQMESYMEDIFTKILIMVIPEEMDLGWVFFFLLSSYNFLYCLILFALSM